MRLSFILSAFALLLMPLSSHAIFNVYGNTSISNGNTITVTGDAISNGAVPAGNVNCNAAACTIGVGTVYTFYSASQGRTIRRPGLVAGPAYVAHVPNGTSWASIASSIRSQQPTGTSRAFSRTFTFDQGNSFPSDFQICAMVIEGYDQSVQYPYWAPIPGTTCMRLPPINRVCSVPSGAVSLDYGTISTSAVNGAVKTAGFQIQCNGASSLRIRTLPSANLGNGVTARLTVDGLSAGGTFNAPSGTSNHTVRSTLSSTSPKAGALRGSSVVIIDFN